MGEQLPLVIHRYWTGGQVPASVVETGEAWRSTAAPWEVRDWTDDTLPAAVAGWLEAHEWRVTPRDRARHKANMLRYLLLWRFGGLWADGDVRPVGPVELLCSVVPAFVASMAGRAEGAVMGSLAGGRYVEELLATVTRERTCGSAVDVSGMTLLNRVLQRVAHGEVRVLPPGLCFTTDASGWPIAGPHLTSHEWETSQVSSVVTDADRH